MTKISQLGAAAGLAGSEVLPIVQDGETKKASVNQLFAFVEGEADRAELAANASESNKNSSETSATLSQAWAESATAPGGAGTKSSKTWAGEAAADADDAAASAATALTAAGPNYASTTAGLAATTNGQAFAVDEGTTIAVYRRDGPSTATFLRRFLKDVNNVVTVYRARADGIERLTGVATAGSTAFTDAGANFTTSDVGKTIWIAGAGSSGAALLTTITARVSATQVTLADQAQTTVAANARYAYGTDNTTAFNTAISVISAAGGGDLYVPSGSGFYLTRNYIRLRDNVWIWGAGYASRIHNVAVSGFAKVVIASGNMGDPTNDLNPVNYGKSLFGEVGYDLNTINVGAFEISLVNAGDAANFAVGDIIGIQSFEKWTGLEPRNSFGKFLNQNEIIAINGATLRLRWSLLDPYPSSAGARPTVHKIGGTSRNGYDNQPLFMSKNCGASNLRLTQVTGGGSGWYALFPSGVNQHYSHIWVDDCSSLVGSNNLSYSSFRHFQGRFEAGLFDFAEWVNNITVEDWIAHRIGANPLLNKIGGAFNKGSDNHARRVTVDLGGWGRLSVFITHRSSIDDCEIYNSGSAAEQAFQPDLNNEAILLGFGNDCEANRNRIVGQYKYGIVIVGERGRAAGNIIPTTRVGFTSIYAQANVVEFFAHDNVLGIDGAYTPQDRVMQQTALSPSAHVYNNTGYVEDLGRRGAQNWAGFAATSQTGTPAVMRSVALPGTTGVVRGYRIQAAGARGGTASTKTVTARLGTTAVGQVNYLAADTGTWTMDITINVRANTNAAHVMSVARMGTTQSSTFQTIANGLVNDTTFTIEGIVANAADSVTVQTLIITPIIEQVI